MPPTLYVGSTVFAPPEWSGRIIVRALSPAEVRQRIDEARRAGVVIRSYVGHEPTARFLGLPMSREQAPPPLPGHYQRWVGLRPVRRAGGGRELDPAVEPQAFSGAAWTITTPPLVA